MALTKRTRRIPTTRNWRIRTRRTRIMSTRKSTTSTLSTDIISDYIDFSKAINEAGGIKKLAGKQNAIRYTPYASQKTLFQKYTLLYQLFPQHCRLAAITLSFSASSTFPAPTTITWASKVTTFVVTSAFKRYRLTIPITPSTVLSTLTLPTIQIQATSPASVYTFINNLRFSYRKAPPLTLDPDIMTS